MGKKKVAAVSGRRSYGIYLAIALLVATNVVMGLWLYQAQGHRVAVPGLLVAGWEGLLSLLGDAYALVESTLRKIAT